jgi:outer membrane protein TolC
MDLGSIHGTDASTPVQRNPSSRRLGKQGLRTAATTPVRPMTATAPAVIPGTRLRPAVLCLWIGCLALLQSLAPRAANATWFDAVPPDPHLEALLTDVLTRNPRLAAMEAGVEATRKQVPQVSAFPDPMLEGTVYLRKPHTPNGPMKGMFAISQRLPWFGKRGLRGDMIEAEADAMAASLDAERLQLAAATRELYYEACFLEAEAKIVEQDVAALQHYEELALAQYATGVGLEQGAIKIQAEISTVRARLLEIQAQQARIRARLNALRDEPASTPVASGEVPRLQSHEIDYQALLAEAESRRPELAAAESQIERSRSQQRLARKQYIPDLTLGFTYNIMGKLEEDPGGHASIPEDNGRDDYGVTAAIDLPIWRGALSAGVEEAALEETRAREELREARAEIAGELADHAARIPLLQERVRLFESILSIQADQSLRSAESAYAAGTATALDLLDALRVRLEARIATERAHTDYVLALSELAASIGRPIALATTR